MLSAFRSRLLWIAAVALIAVGLALLARFWLGGYVVRTVLGMAGASEIGFAQVRGTPALLQVDDLHFRILGRGFSAMRVTLERARWWTASLGNVTIERARMPVVLDGSDVDLFNWSGGADAGLGDDPVSLPFQSLDLDGDLIVQMAMLPDMPLQIKLQARPKSETSWVGTLVAEGAGFRLAGAGSLLRAGQELDFQILSSELDLETWAQHIQRMVILPGMPWKMGGKLTGVAEGSVTARRFAATSRVNLRDGRMRAGTRDVAAEGAEAELEFSDLWKLRTKSGALRMRELRVGRIPLHEVVVDFGLWGGQTVLVNGASFRALGGEARVQSFRYQLSRRDLSAVVEAENLDVSRLLDLLVDRPAEVTGRVDGTLPLRIDETGVRLQRGHLSLRAGPDAALTVKAADLLRSGATLPTTTIEALRSAGEESVKLQLDKLDLEIRPHDIPLGGSARLIGEGKGANGPIAFVITVNGSVEKRLRILP
jgi:hypothetical protein